MTALILRREKFSCLRLDEADALPLLAFSWADDYVDLIRTTFGFVELKESPLVGRGKFEFMGGG
jgi:hypothetical protein